MSNSYLALSSMNENERGEFFQLATEGRKGDLNSMVKFAGMCNKFGFSSKHYKLIDNLLIDLKMNYSFKTIDFHKCLKDDFGKSINELLANGRILVAAPYPYCLFKCTSEADVYIDTIKEETPKPPGMPQETYDDLMEFGETSYFTGCYECCSNENCHPEEY